MQITPQEAYAVACRLLGERQVQIEFMAEALQEAQAKAEPKPEAKPE